MKRKKMKEENIEFMLIFHRKESINLQKIIFLFNNFFLEKYNEQFDELSYSVTVKNHLRSKTLKFSNKNIEKMLLDIPYNGFYATKYLANLENKFTDFEFALRFNFNFNEKLSYVLVTINKQIFLKKYNYNFLKIFFFHFITYLFKEDLQIAYGFVFAMENEQFPNLFVNGIGYYQMPSELRKELNIWTDNWDECGSKIWRIFWGNLISDRHLKTPDSLNRIKEIVGEENFFKVSDSLFFFTLPENNLKYGTEDEKKKAQLLECISSMANEPNNAK